VDAGESAEAPITEELVLAARGPGCGGTLVFLLSALALATALTRK
jgi:hypothetical protein